jgi:hypothetical protein
MRANITINDAGIILAASNAPPPIGGAVVTLPFASLLGQINCAD